MVFAKVNLNHFHMSSQKNSLLKLVSIASVVLLVVAALLIIFRAKPTPLLAPVTTNTNQPSDVAATNSLEAVNQEPAPTTNAPQTTPVVTPVKDQLHKILEIPAQKLVLYLQIIKTTSDGTRSWSTVQFLRSIDGSKPQVIAQAGGVGEQYAGILTNSDQSTVLVSFENKYQILDLTTGQLTNLIVFSDQTYSSAAFSQDGQQLLLWVQAGPGDFTSGGKYSVHVVDVANKQDTVVASGLNTNPGVFSAQVWRADNKVILAAGLGEGSRIYYFDLKTKKIIASPNLGQFGPISNSGKRMAVVTTRIPDVCNDFSGDTNEMHQVIDPVSGTVFATIGTPGRANDVLAISPDDRQALYSVRQTVTNQADCAQEAKLIYNRVVINTGVVTKVNDYQSLLSSWGFHTWAW